MSYEFPANVERDIQKLAKAEHISANEAALKLITEAIKTKKLKSYKKQDSEVDWDKLAQLVPGLELLSELPADVVDEIARSSRRTRAERLTPRV